MRIFRITIIIASIICLIIGYVWKSEKILHFEFSGEYYALPYQFIFLAAAITLAFVFLITTLVQQFKK